MLANNLLTQFHICSLKIELVMPNINSADFSGYQSVIFFRFFSAVNFFFEIHIRNVRNEKTNILT